VTEDDQPTRLFTVDEANAVLPRLRPLLEQLKAAHEAMEERYEAVMASVPGNGGGDVHQGLPIVFDYLIVTHRLASGDADLGLAGVLVHHRVQPEHRVVRMLDVEEKLLGLFSYRDHALLLPSPHSPLATRARGRRR
jgi:hypothetical protein